MKPELVDDLLSGLEEVTAHLRGSTATDLEQMAALLRRRATLASALQAALHNNPLSPAQGERVRAIVAAGWPVEATLRQTAAECRNQLRDLYREAILVQALAPAVDSEPCEIDCCG